MCSQSGVTLFSLTTKNNLSIEMLLFLIASASTKRFSVSENCSSMVLNWSVCEGVDRLAQEESLPRLGV
jgi:hypothetical protein